ncbi:MAG TPA: GNAT family acetyltransferase [Bradyrhizobium sp.]|uniref:GNAT family acetyltransferase n=1 Tax=Bradyrhizobium sp. TaxID=376 RepID=UPI002D808D62|nr:GNAT family acetyltransferase [Bradyrhizobium sp.]HET7886820.1 GNAT family acetyltransferase [Bradyrhizobium sp.]
MTSALQSLAITPIRDADVAGVVALWQACGLTRPWNDPAADIALARRGENSTVLVGREGDTVVGTAMIGHDGHRGWVYYLAVDPDHRHKGVGRIMMDAAERWLRDAGIEKLQLMVRPDNAGVRDFYQSLGYAAQERIIYAKWLDGREPTP